MGCCINFTEFVVKPTTQKIRRTFLIKLLTRTSVIRPLENKVFEILRGPQFLFYYETDRKRWLGEIWSQDLIWIIRYLLQLKQDLILRGLQCVCSYCLDFRKVYKGIFIIYTTRLLEIATIVSCILVCVFGFREYDKLCYCNKDKCNKLSMTINVLCGPSSLFVLGERILKLSLFLWICLIFFYVRVLWWE